MDREEELMRKNNLANFLSSMPPVKTISNQVQEEYKQYESQHNFTEDQLQNSHLEESHITLANNSSLMHHSSRIFNEEDMH